VVPKVAGERAAQDLRLGAKNAADASSSAVFDVRLRRHGPSSCLAPPFDMRWHGSSISGTAVTFDRAKRLVICALLLGPACAGSSFRDGVYQDAHVRYRVGGLPDWQRIDVEDNDLAFHSRRLGAISVNSTCSEYEDVPPSALVNHLLFEMTERRFLLEETVTLDGRGARHVIVQAELDGVPVEVELFVLKKNGCVFDLSHIRSPVAGPAARAVFLSLVGRFDVLQVNPHE
jgi:hypothetical protein